MSHFRYFNIWYSRTCHKIAGHFWSHSGFSISEHFSVQSASKNTAVNRSAQLFFAESKIQLGRAVDAHNYTDIKPWNFWKTHCAGLPLIRAVGITVLSKQAGIGANERAHKETKQLLTKARNRLETQRAARSVYIRHNRRLLDKLAVEMYTMDYDEPEDITTLTLEPEEVTATLEALALQGDPREQDGIDEPDESRTESAAPSRDDCLLDLGSLSGSDSDDSG